MSATTQALSTEFQRPSSAPLLVGLLALLAPLTPLFILARVPEAAPKLLNWIDGHGGQLGRVSILLAAALALLALLDVLLRGARTPTTAGTVIATT